MPLDAVCVSGLAAELGAALAGARIDKVQQPAKDALLLSVYAPSGARRLLLSASGGGARAHFTQEKYENPDKPPMFCMLLRKHLTGARIDAVEQPESGEPDQPSSWAKEAWKKAVALGIFDGTNPQGNLTREQAAVILDRLGQLPEQGGG